MVMVKNNSNVKVEVRVSVAGYGSSDWVSIKPKHSHIFPRFEREIFTLQVFFHDGSIHDHYFQVLPDDELEVVNGDVLYLNKRVGPPKARDFPSNGKNFAWNK